MRQFLWKAHAAALLASLSLWSAGLHAAQPTAVSVMELLELEGWNKGTEALMNLNSFDDVIRLANDPKMKNTPAFQTGLEQLDAISKGVAHLPPEAQAEFKALLLEMMKAVTRVVASKEFRIDVFRAYQQTYTQEEVDAWIEFLKTPIGQSAAFKKAGLQEVIKEIALPHMTKLRPELRRISEKWDAIENKYKSKNTPSKKNP